MPTVTRDGVELYYETAGTGETVAFVNDVGYGAWLWGWQHGPLARGHETLVWDLRGTGRSDAPESPYDVDTLAADFEAVLGAAGVDRAHVVGAGLGGMVALRHVAISGRTRTLALFCTAGSGNLVEEPALRALHPQSANRDRLSESLAGALSPAFREGRPDLVEQICDWRVADDANPEAVRAQMSAALSFEARELYEVDQPALVAHGLQDPVVPVEAGQQLSEDLPGATFAAVEGRHLCLVEHAGAVTDRLVAHLEEHDL